MKIKICEADKEFSRAIKYRDNWTCQRCHRQHPIGSSLLQTSHYFGRIKESVRFDIENVDTLCFGCHQYSGSTDREEYRNFKIKQLGQAGFDKLTLRAHLYKKKDRKMELLKAKELLRIYKKKDE